MFKWYFDRQTKRMAAVEKKLNWERDARKRAEDSVLRKTQKMVTTNCPIMGKTCSEGCVHFGHGYTKETSWDGVQFVFDIGPRCKLWSD